MPWYLSVIVAGFASVTVVTGALFFRRYEITRPPIGVFTFGDVVVLMLGVVAIPYLYLVLPVWAVVALVGPVIFAILSFTLEPVVRKRERRRLAVLGLILGDYAAALIFGVDSNAYLAVNNLVVLLVVLGIANLWVQSGMGSGHVALLAVLLAVYDYVATSLLTLTVDLVDRLDGIPLSPFLAWTSAPEVMAIGLGDVLLATAFPLAIWKAYGARAARMTVAVSIAVIMGVLSIFALELFEGAVPVMVVLGPAIAAQHLFWHKRRGPERTTGEYLAAEPMRPRTAIA